jgi:cation diffusion facilitator family transporter
MSAGHSHGSSRSGQQPEGTAGSSNDQLDAAGRHDRSRDSHADHEHEHGHEHGDHGHGHDHGHAHGGIRGAITGLLKPHSHDAGDKVDSALTASAEGMRALKISLVVLGVTALFQVVIVVISGSVALLADTVHNFTDALTAVPLGIAFVVGRRAANRRYTYGYGRAEDIAGLFVLLTMLGSALLAAYEAIDRIINPRDLDNLWWVAVAGIVGFAGNEWVALYRIRVGRRIGSAALIADGLHARTDGLTSLAVLIGAVGVAAGWRLADPIIGLVISAAIFGVLVQAAKEVFGRMMDRVDERMALDAEHAIGSVPGVVGVDRLRLRWVGHELLAEVDVRADAALTFVAAHALGEQVRHRLLHDVRRLVDATVHVGPDVPDAEAHGGTAHHFTSR